MLKICSLQKIRPPELARPKRPNGTWWLTGNGLGGHAEMTNRPDAVNDHSIVKKACQALSASDCSY